MKALFKLIANKEDISAKLEDRLLSINISDEYGLVSDTITIELDDRDEIFSIPERGAEIEAFLGYEGGSLYSMGKFVVDEVELAGLPHKLLITGRASNPTYKDDMGAFLVPRSFSWETHSLLGIVRKIAERYGLKDSVGEDFMNIIINHIDQADESDAAFLQRLARDNGAVVKIAGGVLMFFAPARGCLPNGTPLPSVQIDVKNCASYLLRITERGKYSRVVAKYYDFDDAEEKKVIVGTGEPTFSLREISTSAATARQRAKSKLEEFEQGCQELSLEIVGNPLISAETRIDMVNVRTELLGAWIIKQTRHSFTSSGYHTSIEAIRPINHGKGK